MNSSDYKKIFKSFPERAWLLSTLKSIIETGKYNELSDYLSGKKDIDQVNDVEQLYKIKSEFLMLRVDCKAIIDNIEKLNLDFLGEFDDKKMDLSEIGINEGDTFVCVNNFRFWGMVQINVGTVIFVKELRYAGNNSHLDCEIISLNTDEKTTRSFPNPSEIKLLLTFQELSSNFEKQ